MIRKAVILGLLLLAGFSSRSAFAELPLIRLDRVFPLGGSAGSEVMVEIQGRDLDDAKTLQIDHPGIRADWIKEKQFRLKIAADVPPATYEIRVVGQYGISAGRLFAVSRGLAEVLETEPNNTPQEAGAVPFNCAINGSCDGNGDDYFRFPAKKGSRVTLDAQAFRLDSTLRASLSVSTSGGDELARSKPYYNRTDPLLDVVIPADGEYLVRIHDATFAGGEPYCLVVSDRPLVENTFPCVVLPGETTELTVYGRNLPAGDSVGGWEVGGLPLDRVTLPFAVPDDPAARFAFTVLNPLPSPSLAARGLQARPKGLEDALNPVTLLLADAPVTREQEPNDTVDKPQNVTLPTYVAGRIDMPGDADWFAFNAKKGEPLGLDLFCERLDLPGDLRILITDEKGKEQSILDDHGIRSNSLDMFNRDPQGTFNPPADATYRVLIQDIYGAGGPRFVYALRLTRLSPDFFPVVTHETPNEPTSPLVRQGGSAFVEFCPNRRDEFRGPITVEAEGLPPGVFCPPVYISPQAQAVTPIVFTAAPDAPEWSGVVRLKAWATIDDKRVERLVQCSRRRWAIGNVSTSRLSREISLAVRPTAPYGLKTPTDPKNVIAGETLETVVSVQRYWPDFKGKVQVNGLDLPPGFEVGTAEISEGKTETAVQVKVASNVPAGTYTVVFRGDAQVPFSPDPKPRPALTSALPTLPRHSPSRLPPPPRSDRRLS